MVWDNLDNLIITNPSINSAHDTSNEYKYVQVSITQTFTFLEKFSPAAIKKNKFFNFNFKM